MADQDPVTQALARLGAAFGPQAGASWLPQLPELPSLGGGSGLPSVTELLGNVASGFPSIHAGSSGFGTFTDPGNAYDKSEGALAQAVAQRRNDLKMAREAALDPSVSAFSAALAARQARVTGQRAGAGAATSPDQFPDAMLADSPQNVTRWYPLAKKYADQYSVPVEDILAVIENESGGNPGARSGVNPGNQGRAVGLMQLIPLYHGTDGADLTDPETNIQRGVRYYAQAYHKRGKDSRKAMAEFFGGGGAFDGAGNVREDIGDINIKMGPYLDGKFLPAKQRWANRLASGPPTAGTGGATTRQAAGALNLAARQLGKPYVFGGASEAAGFDCSGLMQWAFRQQGVNVGRTAQEQWNNTRRISNRELAAGDLVFFKNTYNAGTPITHVGMYAGNGQMLMAMAEGKPVQYVPLNSSYWQEHLAGYGRVG